MGNDPEAGFVKASKVGSGPEGGTELPLILGEGTFDMNTAAVDAVEKPAAKLPSVLVLGPGAPSPRVDRNHRRANTQDLAAERMMSFAVVSAIGQHTVQR